jgi:hypothetical protein
MKASLQNFRNGSSRAKAGRRVFRGGRGIALIITLIMLSVITFMAVTFLVVSQHGKEQMSTTTQQIVAQQAAEAGLQQAEARIMGGMMSQGNGFNFGLLVSTNYESQFFDATIPGTNVANANYFVDNSGNPLNQAEYLRMLNNLMVAPRPPVFITTNPAFPPDFRFYWDLNRNGVYDPSTINGFPIVITNQFGFAELVTGGDPEWIGVLEHPDQPHSRSNLFIARFCFFAQPIGNSLDIDFIHNNAKQLSPNVDGFLRNQGVGPWEINLAGFLNGLNPYFWNYLNYDTTPPPAGPFSSTGLAFQDAAAILEARYGLPAGYNNLYSFGSEYPQGAFEISSQPNYVDYYSLGALTGFGGQELPPQINDNLARPWSGSDAVNHMFTTQDFFGLTTGQLPASSFTNRLYTSGLGGPGPFGLPASQDPRFNEYTYYRMLSQIGMDSAPEPGNKLNLNYKNVDGYSASNFVSWAEDANPAVNVIQTNALEFFTNAADRLLGTQPNYVITLPWTNALTNLSTHFIPIYPTNYYTPSVHRMLQLAANIYDAANPKTNSNGNPASYFDYPSVFRPTFWATNIGGRTYIYINGYQEVQPLGRPVSTPTTSAAYGGAWIAANNLSYLSPPVSMSVVSNVFRSGQNITNVYGIPWVVGVKKGLPNFNQISMESFTALTRKIVISKGASATTPRNQWTTNTQYILSVSNAIMVEAWNSYSNFYPRSVDIGGLDLLFTTLSNASGPIGVTSTFRTPPPTFNGYLMTLPMVPAATWPGLGPNLSADQSQTFRFPLNQLEQYVEGGIYSTNAGGVGVLGEVGNPLTTPITQNSGNILPTFLYNLSNSMQFVMVDDATGRVIDYVQLEGMGGQRSLTSGAELLGNDDWGPGGVWDTNHVPINSSNPNSLLHGIQNQIQASLQPPSFTEAGYATPVTVNDWNQAVVQTMGFQSVTAAANSFNAFYNGNTAVNPSVSMQVPFTPTRNVCVYYTWQANDPLVHYTLPDLTDFVDALTGPQTNWVMTNVILGNIGQINKRYEPWGGGLNGGNAAYNTNLSLKDPMVMRSDNWMFPNYQLPGIGWLGRVHRGTPWQTVYMKSAPVDPNLWQSWTGNAAIVTNANTGIYSDSLLSQPTNDWAIFDLFTTAPDPNLTRGQLSVNQPGYASWAALLDGVVALTNTTNGLAPITIDPNLTAGALVSIYNGINNARLNSSNQVFTREGEILAAPQLSVQSPFLDQNPNDTVSAGYLNDAAYEWLPQQIMSLVRVGSPRYVVYVVGQALKPADRSIVTGGQFAGTCTNYQITGEVATRTVLRFEPSVPLLSANPFTALNPSQNPVMVGQPFRNLGSLPLGSTNIYLETPTNGQFAPRAVVESYTVLPPQ